VKDNSLQVATPRWVDISVFAINQRDEAESSQKVLQCIRDKFSSKSIIADSNGAEFSIDGKECSVRLLEQSDCHTFTVTIDSSNADYVSKNWENDLSNYLRYVDPILQMLPKKPISEFTIFIGLTESQIDALSLLQQYSGYFGSPDKARGITRNCLVATFKKATTTDSDTVGRNFLISPFGQSTLESKFNLSDFCEELAHSASIVGRLNNLCRLDEPFFKSITGAEQAAQLKNDEIFRNIGNLEQIELGVLKSWLGSLTYMFSSLSVLTGAMRRDYAKAQAYLTEINNLLSKWKEKSFEGISTNLSAEVMECETLARPFKTFLDRSDALRTQIETILDTIRTYLSIRQQEQTTDILRAAEKNEKLLKNLTWIMTFFTVALVILEILRH
jgi:hypothetical protein